MINRTRQFNFYFSFFAILNFSDFLETIKTPGSGRLADENSAGVGAFEYTNSIWGIYAVNVYEKEKNEQKEVL